MKLDAILWDYDGTIVNSVPKNIEITKSILSIVAPRLIGDNLPKCLLSEAAYHHANHAAKNWQELYVNYYGMTESEMQVAGTLWAEHQLSNTTPVKLFTGIDDVVRRLSSIPYGICSQNASMNIRNVLSEAKIDSFFKSIIGYDDVLGDAQKPAAAGGLICLEQLFDSAENKTVMYIGDHEADVQFARNVQAAFGKKLTVISVAAAYSGAAPEHWSVKPDYIIREPSELATICEPCL